MCRRHCYVRNNEVVTAGYPMGGGKAQILIDVSDSGENVGRDCNDSDASTERRNEIDEIETREVGVQ